MRIDDYFGWMVYCDGFRKMFAKAANPFSISCHMPGPLAFAGAGVEGVGVIAIGTAAVPVAAAVADVACAVFCPALPRRMLLK